MAATSPRQASASPLQLAALSALLACLLGPASLGATENVGPGGHATIQAGIDAAVPGETVLVAPGTYTENSILINKELVLMSSGGAASTIIDGSDTATVIRIRTASVTRNTIVEGFTIRNGRGPGGGEGGCMTIRDSAAPTIQDNVFENCRSELSGGAIKVSNGASAAILDNIIRMSSAVAAGGGLHIDGITGGASGLVSGNIIHDNSVDTSTNSSGGGIKVSFATNVVIDDNTISDNTVTFAGGGISVFAADADVTNNDITGNDGGEFAGGVHFETNVTYGARSFLLEGNTINNNTATNLGGGVHTQGFETASAITVRGNTLIGNTALNVSCSEISCPAASCGKGGGLSAQRSTAQTIEANTFRQNRADCHGAALISGTPLAVMFLGNTVDENGARFNYPSVACVDIVGCTIADNIFLANAPESFSPGAFNPGALYLTNSGQTLVENNHFGGNVGDFAGAIHVRNNGTGPTFRNNTFVDNTTTEMNTSRGGTIRTEVDADFANNIFSGDVRAVELIGTLSITYDNNAFFAQTAELVDGHSSLSSLNSESFANGNLEVDPDLVEPTVGPRIATDSPVLGQARCDLDPADDFEGETRPATGCDIGADEVTESIFADGFESGNTTSWS